MNNKRSAEEVIPMQRRTRIKLASPSPERDTESDTESIHSCQGYKTEQAKDTSDTSDSSVSPVPQVFHTEYEIVDTDSVKQKFYYSDDSNEQEDLKSVLFNLDSTDSLDNAILGDTSEENSTSPTSNSDVDPGLPRNDYLDFENCLLCKTDKKNISYPYCSNCYTWKKNIFPSRPKRRRRGLKRNGSLPTSLNTDYSNTVDNKTKQCSSADGLLEDSGVGSAEPQLSEDTVDAPSQPSTSSSTVASILDSSTSNNSESCRVCFLKPETGLFVHSNIAHRYGCYSCAKEIWYQSGVCPLCRRKVFKVTKLYLNV